MSKDNKRKCPSINSGMLDKLNNFSEPRTSLDFGKLGYQEFEAMLEIVDVRRPYCSFDFKKQTFIRDLSALGKQRGC